MQRHATNPRPVRAHQTPPTERKDPHQIVTDAIVRALEGGVPPWKQSWQNTKGLDSPPLRHNSEPYRGINTLILWATAMERGFAEPWWLTFRQALELGGCVRKGEKGTMVVYYGTAAKRDAGEDEDPRYRFVKTFWVFHASQVDGLPDSYRVAPPQVIAASDRKAEIDALIARTGITVRHGGNRAYYDRVDDRVQMPAFEAFASPEMYYATAFHELVHASAAQSRLDRDFGQRCFGDEGYAKEELVAELGAAFIGARLGFPAVHLEDHASYLDSWLRVLKGDKRFLFQAAAKAQAAADYLLGTTVAEEGPAEVG